MRIRAFAVCFLTIPAMVACANLGWKHPVDGPVVPGAENIEVRFMSEEGDSWLYEHCTYKGAITANGPHSAAGEAVQRGANFIEPLANPDAGITSDPNHLFETYIAFSCATLPPT